MDTPVPICIQLPLRIPTFTEAITKIHTFLTGQAPESNSLTRFDQVIDREMVQPCLSSGLPIPLELLACGIEYVLLRTACEVGRFYLCGQQVQQRDSADLEIGATINAVHQESSHRLKTG